jgi:hypothetical protein
MILLPDLSDKGIYSLLKLCKNLRGIIRISKPKGRRRQNLNQNVGINDVLQILASDPMRSREDHPYHPS